MNYWRMQLHPNDPENSVWYACESLAAGFIGLDFADDPGDLERINKSELATQHRDYWDFANTMKQNDLVLVMAHHFPLALTRVSGPYNYIKETAGELGVWFRHFRRIDREKLAFYGDYVKTPPNWQHITMTDTISILNDQSGQSYQLMQQWAEDLDW